MIESRNGVSALSGSITVQCYGRRTGVVVIGSVSSEYSVGTKSLDRNTGLVVGDRLSVVRSDTTSVRLHGITKHTGVLNNHYVREESRSGTGDRSRSTGIRENGDVGPTIAVEIEGTGDEFSDRGLGRAVEKHSDTVSEIVDVSFGVVDGRGEGLIYEGRDFREESISSFFEKRGELYLFPGGVDGIEVLAMIEGIDGGPVDPNDVHDGTSDVSLLGDSDDGYIIIREWVGSGFDVVDGESFIDVVQRGNSNTVSGGFIGVTEVEEGYEPEDDQDGNDDDELDQCETGE